MVDKKTGIWDLATAKKKHSCDFLLAGIIGYYFKPLFAADLGCGPGHYCKIFKAFGWPNVHGYEGTPDIYQCCNAYNDIMEKDLTEELSLPYDYDFVLCLEVGEHIPKEFEQIFLDNVCSLTKKDLVLSWAVPGQGGTAHVNEQPNEYIIAQCEQRNLKLQEKLTKRLRKYSSLKWFKNTLLVFNK